MDMIRFIAQQIPFEHVGSEHEIGLTPEIHRARREVSCMRHLCFIGRVNESSGLARRLGMFDVTMLVMGGTIGSGIFVNPYVVARQIHTPFLIFFVWVFGGLVALTGAFVYAELSARHPDVGGQYAYLRDGIHPGAAFLYGWALLLVIQTGGMAAVALTFARYFLEIVPISAPDFVVAIFALAVLTVINCLGVRAGSSVQNALMVLKILAICMLVFCGLFLASSKPIAHQALDRPLSFDLLTAIGAGLVPVLFAYGGFQTANFVAGEIKDPRRNLPRGLIIGVSGVILLYLAVNFVCIRVLGADNLAVTNTPASAVMRVALGGAGARIIATGIAISTLGFLSQGMLTAPRVYFAMAQDGLFFKSVGQLHPTSHAPVLAIALQGLLAMIIGISGRYEQILNYVVSADFLFFGLTGLCLFVFRGRKNEPAQFQVPGHPFSTLFFIAASWLVVLATLYKYPANSAIGLALILAGVPVYSLWRPNEKPQRH